MIRKRDRSTRSFYDNIKENIHAQRSINKKKLILEKRNISIILILIKFKK